MPMELTVENLKKAYLETLKSTGIGAVESNSDGVLAEKVKKAIPLEKQDTYPEVLLEAAKRICTREPYGWIVRDELPSIDDNTSFQMLFDDWLSRMVND